MPDNTSRFSINGQPIHHFVSYRDFSENYFYSHLHLYRWEHRPFPSTQSWPMYQSSRSASRHLSSEFACSDVVLPRPGVPSSNSQESVGPSQLPTPTLKLLTSVITAGSTVAVFGCGAIGLGVINTAANVGASRIIAIDINPGKEAWAKRFGATDFVNSGSLKEGQRIQDYLVEITDGGLDFTFDCTGNVSPYGVLQQEKPKCQHFVFIQGPCYASCTRSLPQGLGRIDCHRGRGRWAGDLNEAVCVLPSPSRHGIYNELNHSPPQIPTCEYLDFHHCTFNSKQIILQRSLDGLGVELHSEVSRAERRSQD